MTLLTVEVWKQLPVLVPVRLVIRQVVSEWLHSRLAKLLGVPTCPQMARCGEIVFGAQYSENRIRKLGSELLSAVC